MKENRFKRFWPILKATAKGWNADDPFRQSAVIAYYAVFSMPALLVLMINAMGFFFEREALSGEISKQISGVMGKDTAEMVESMIEKAGQAKSGIISTIIAIVTILFGATGVFIQFQKSLNLIWDVQEKPDLGFKKQLKTRFFSFGLILSIGFLLLSSLVISTALAGLSERLQAIFPDAIAYLFYLAEFIISLGVITVLFALMFKLLPDVKIPWRMVWTGAVITGLLFMAGKYLLSLYFGKAEPGSNYGAAGSVILVLLWVSYSSMIVFFGAEFTKQYAVHKGLHIEPTKDAVKIDNSILAGEKMEDKEHALAVQEEKRVAKKEIGKQDAALNVQPEKAKAPDQPKDAMPEPETLSNARIRSIKELRAVISRGEEKLSAHKEDIKDDFKPRHLLGDLLTRKVRRHAFAGELHWNDYMKGVAQRHIGHKETEESRSATPFRKFLRFVKGEV